MNWGAIVAALIVAGGFVIGAHAIATAQKQNAIALIAGQLVAGRLGDTAYMEQIRNLRLTVHHGLDEYPGSEERVREKEEEIKFAEEMLAEIDYMEDSVRAEWINLACHIYRGAQQQQA